MKIQDLSKITNKEYWSEMYDRIRRIPNKRGKAAAGIGILSLGATLVQFAIVEIQRQYNPPGQNLQQVMDIMVDRSRLNREYSVVGMLSDTNQFNQAREEYQSLVSLEQSIRDLDTYPQEEEEYERQKRNTRSGQNWTFGYLLLCFASFGYAVKRAPRNVQIKVK